MWGAVKATRASSSGSTSRRCRRSKAKACQTRMVWLPSTRLFPKIHDEPKRIQADALSMTFLTVTAKSSQSMGFRAKDAIPNSRAFSSEIFSL